jgi:hypothetical protein
MLCERKRVLVLGQVDLPKGTGGMIDWPDINWPGSPSFDRQDINQAGRLGYDRLGMNPPGLTYLRDDS